MASNLYVNRVDYGNTTLIDISDTTATASDVASGKTFYLASGQQATGTASGGGGGSGLPASYTRIPYVEADGNQYVDTGVIPAADTTVECEFQLQSTTTYGYVFGSLGYGFLCTGGAVFQTLFGANYVSFSSITPDKNCHLVTKTVSSTSLTSPDVATEIKTTTGTFPTNVYSIALFAQHSGAASYTNKGRVRIFSCRIWNGNTLQKDLVPAVNTNSAVGLYDLVSGTFYTSDSGTALIAGSYPHGVLSITANDNYDVFDYATAAVSVSGSGSRLPVGYVELDYVRSTGVATCYLNTNYTPVSNTRVVCEFRLQNTGSSNVPIFGVAGQFSFRRYNASTFRTNGSNNVDFSTVTPDTNKHTVIKTPSGTILDGECKTTTAATISYPIFLCGYNNSGSNSQTVSAEIYSFKIYTGNLLERDYVPCKNANNIAGFYDLVNSTFNPSSGSADFIAGDPI